MTIEQALINIKKELKCRNDEELYCKNHECCDDKCPFYVDDDEFRESLQILYDWFRELKERPIPLRICHTCIHQSECPWSNIDNGYCHKWSENIQKQYKEKQSESTMEVYMYGQNMESTKDWSL